MNNTTTDSSGLSPQLNATLNVRELLLIINMFPNILQYSLLLFRERKDDNKLIIR